MDRGSLASNALLKQCPCVMQYTQGYTCSQKFLVHINWYNNIISAVPSFGRLYLFFPVNVLTIFTSSHCLGCPTSSSVD